MGHYFLLSTLETTDFRQYLSNKGDPMHAIVKPHTLLISGTQTGFGVYLKQEFERHFNVVGLVRNLKDPSKEISWDFSLPFRQQLESWRKIEALLDSQSVIGLIHNAGVLGAAACSDEQKLQKEYWDDFDRAFLINFRNPVELLEHLLAKFRLNKIDSVQRFLVHISTGAASAPYIGLDAYCSSKAAMMMQTKVWSLQQDPTELLTFGFAPGVLNTAMNQSILAFNPEHFPNHSRFIEIKDKNLYQNSGDSAKKLLSILLQPPLENSAYHGELVDVRKLT